MSEKEFIRNELLCFLQKTSAFLKFDDLVNISTDFYTTDEIKGALASVYNFVDHRIPTYKGADKEKKTVADLLKLVVNPEVGLPTYVAVDITHLPPVGVDHIDLSAILKELVLLRSEVRGIGLLRTELDEVKSTVQVLQQRTVQAQNDNVQVQPSTMADNPVNGVKGSGRGNKGATTFATKAQELQCAGIKQFTRRQPVVGSSTTVTLKVLKLYVLLTYLYHAYTHRPQVVS